MATSENTDLPASVRTLADLDIEAQKINANRGWSLTVSSRTLSRRRGAFHDAALLQLLITWARLNADGRLRIQSGDTTATVGQLLQDCCDYSVGVGALALAPEIQVQGHNISRPFALMSATSRMESAYAGQFDRIAKGRCVDLLTVSGARRQFLKPLFGSKNGLSAVKDKFELKPALRGLVSQAHPRAASFLDDSTIAAISNLTHELFENTQEHAISDVRQQQYRRHVEGIFVSWTTLTDEIVKEDFFVNGKLRDYWATIASAQRVENESVSGIAFSFVDSGPGMAARYAGKDYFELAPQDERKALEECLHLRATSKAHGGAGIGLTEVLVELAELHGLIRIRSGRLSLFKAFAPGRASVDLHEGFADWYEDKSILPRVSGTLISIFIPLPRA